MNSSNQQITFMEDIFDALHSLSVFTDDKFTEKDVFIVDEKIKDLIKKKQTEIFRLENDVSSVENDEIKEIIEELKSDTTFDKYISVSEKILQKISETLKKPVKKFFFSKKKPQDTTTQNINSLIENYVELLKEIAPININQEEEKHTCECGNTTDFILSEMGITCEICGIEKNQLNIQTCFKDTERVNLNQKYKYKRIVHFKDTLYQFQGKQNKTITEKVYEDIKGWLFRHNIVDESGDYSKITKTQIKLALSETKNNSYYEDIKLIHSNLTGIPCRDLSTIELLLLEDFQKFIDVFDTLVLDRKSILNSQYVLYQFLKRYNVDVEEEDFEFLKSKDKLRFHDEVYQICAEMLSWNHVNTI